MTLLINLYWQLHPVWKRGLKVFEGSSTVYLTRIWTCSLGINFTAAKTQSSSSSCSFPLFLPPSMSSIWRGCRGWRALQIPWQTWASEAGTCQGYFYCRCPWGFTKLFRALCLSSLISLFLCCSFLRPVWLQF